MLPTLIGYFPKRTKKCPDWLKAAGVEEVCSVSSCVSDGPENWIDHWQHNAMWVFDTPELAWSVVPELTRNEFDLYAYRMFPVEFVEGKPEPFEIPQSAVAPMPASFERLGLDIVNRTCNSNFECSPLSCNSMADKETVSRYCLLDDVAVAFRLAAEFEAGGCEPGPYYVMEVWRQSSAK
jgi:hypothetical protein